MRQGVCGVLSCVLRERHYVQTCPWPAAPGCPLLRAGVHAALVLRDSGNGVAGQCCCSQRCQRRLRCSGPQGQRGWPRWVRCPDHLRGRLEQRLGQPLFCRHPLYRWHAVPVLGRLVQHHRQLWDCRHVPPLPDVRAWHSAAASSHHCGASRGRGSELLLWGPQPLRQLWRWRVCLRDSVPQRPLLPRQPRCCHALPSGALLPPVRSGALTLPRWLIRLCPWVPCVHAVPRGRLWRSARPLLARLQRQLQRAARCWLRRGLHLPRQCHAVRAGLLLPGRHPRARAALRPGDFFRRAGGGCLRGVPRGVVLRGRRRSARALRARHGLHRAGAGSAAPLLLECEHAGGQRRGWRCQWRGDLCSL